MARGEGLTPVPLPLTIYNRSQMPKAFDRCVKARGRVRTLKPKGRCSRAYLPVCFPRGGGPSVAGELKYARKLPDGCRRRRR